MSRQGVSPEEIMNVAKSVARGEGIQDQSYGHDQTYGNNSGYDPAANGLDQSSGQDQYTSNAHQQPYNDASQQQQYQVDEGYGGEQQGNYSDSTGMNNSNASGGAAGNRGGGQLDTYSTPQDYQDSGPNMQGAQGSQGRQGTQASGQGFGQGFDQGFDQGLAGGPGGSQPHSGVEITEQSGPGYESRDADLHTTGSAQGGGYETHQHHRDTFETKSVIQGS